MFKFKFLILFLLFGILSASHGQSDDNLLRYSSSIKVIPVDYQCPICMESFANTEDVCKANCNSQIDHIFCKTCFITNIKQNKSFICTLCRQPLKHEYQDFFDAIRGGNTDIINRLMAESNISPDIKCENEYILEIACNANHYNVVRLLLEKNVNINQTNALSNTILNNQFDISELLLNQGGQINKLTITNAIRFDNVGALEFCLQKGSKIDTQDIIMALVKENDNILKLIKHHGYQISRFMNMIAFIYKNHRNLNGLICAVGVSVGAAAAVSLYSNDAYDVIKASLCAVGSLIFCDFIGQKYFNRSSRYLRF